jgi:hypothetical protein
LLIPVPLKEISQVLQTSSHMMKLNSIDRHLKQHH